ncbi:MAG: dinitrogenase iron-molybdenum cofactor biosynthesis protein [Pelosinus sp.]|nr:dinitrogenase iron-molybdenum cofactor biosynthesis protein [Pelosinus sp.]
MAKVAVASTDGLSINEHFGKSKEFLIYEVDEAGGYTFLERRERDEESPQNIHELFADVEAVLAAQIGPRAQAELKSQGILSFQVTGDIPKALTAYGKRAKFVRSSFVTADLGVHRGDGSGCGGCPKGCR